MFIFCKLYNQKLKTISKYQGVTSIDWAEIITANYKTVSVDKVECPSIKFEKKTDEVLKTSVTQLWDFILDSNYI